MQTTDGMDRGSGRPTAFCGGRTRGGGECRRPAGWGTGHPGIGRCSYHGGATPNHEKAAKAEMARRTLARYRPVPITDPAGRMAEVTAEIDALYRAVRERLCEHEIDEWLTDDLRPHVALLRELLVLMRGFLGDWQRLGMEARMVALDERRAELVCSVMAAALESIGLPADVLDRARAAVGEQLALIGAAA